MHDDEDEQREEGGSHWYFFVPLVLLGLWGIQLAALGVVDLITPGAEWRLRGFGVGPTHAIGLLLDVGDGVGVLGWSALYICYFVLLSRKRASGWWQLGGLCLGLNLLLYLALFFLPPRQPVKFPAALPQARARPFGRGDSSRSSTSEHSSFVCEACGALLNYGVSECDECGERYSYGEGSRAGV